MVAAQDLQFALGVTGSPSWTSVVCVMTPTFVTGSHLDSVWTVGLLSL